MHPRRSECFSYCDSFLLKQSLGFLFQNYPPTQNILCTCKRLLTWYKEHFVNFCHSLTFWLTSFELIGIWDMSESIESVILWSANEKCLQEECFLIGSVHLLIHSPSHYMLGSQSANERQKSYFMLFRL